MKLLLYCTKAKPYLYRQDDDTFELSNKINYEDISGYTNYYGLNNGKIVAECDFEVEEIFEDNYEDARDGYVEHFYTLKSYDDFDEGQKALLKKSCLQKHELSNYLGFENGFAIHIKNLKIFDEPKELSEYGMDFPISPIVKAPQNMMYANGIGERYILISIRPEHLVNILNGNKTIEIRKKILKEMKE